MSGPRHAPEPGEARRSLAELAVAALTVVVVMLAVAAVVFGLIVVLYDHGEPVAQAMIAASRL